MSTSRKEINTVATAATPAAATATTREEKKTTPTATTATATVRMVAATATAATPIDGIREALDFDLLQRAYPTPLAKQLVGILYEALETLSASKELSPQKPKKSDELAAFARDLVNKYGDSVYCNNPYLLGDICDFLYEASSSVRRFLGFSDSKKDIDNVESHWVRTQSYLDYYYRTTTAGAEARSESPHGYKITSPKIKAIYAALQKLPCLTSSDLRFDCTDLGQLFRHLGFFKKQRVAFLQPDPVTWSSLSRSQSPEWSFRSLAKLRNAVRRSALDVDATMAKPGFQLKAWEFLATHGGLDTLPLYIDNMQCAYSYYAFVKTITDRCVISICEEIIRTTPLPGVLSDIVACYCDDSLDQRKMQRSVSLHIANYLLNETYLDFIRKPEVIGSLSRVHAAFHAVKTAIMTTDEPFLLSLTIALKATQSHPAHAAVAAALKAEQAAKRKELSEKTWTDFLHCLENETRNTDLPGDLKTRYQAILSYCGRANEECPDNRPIPPKAYLAC